MVAARERLMFQVSSGRMYEVAAPHEEFKAIMVQFRWRKVVGFFPTMVSADPFRTKIARSSVQGDFAICKAFQKKARRLVNRRIDA
jgi:hypothetical protein